MYFPCGIETGAVAIVTNDEGQFLLGLSTEGRGWSIPGGHVNPGETVIQCLHRETGEEIGCDIDVLGALGSVEIIVETAPGIGKHAIVFPFVVKIKQGCTITVDNDELSSVKWVSFSEFKKELFVHYQGIIPLLEKWLQSHPLKTP